jgi:hypothetical protein
VGNPKRIAVELAAVALLAAIALGFGIQRAGIASGHVDPILHAGAQDEAVYGHAAARMVRTGHWLTPVFLDRFMLNKPPLLFWTGAASMRALGIGPLALRLPVLVAGVLCCVLAYWWVRRSSGIPTAACAVLLLLGSPLFFSMNRRFMTDALLTLFVVASMFVTIRDPHWERQITPIVFGALSGAAILTKSAAGLLPLLIIAVYCVLERLPLLRVLAAFGIAVLVAAPWHIYELLVHKDWFIAEYIQFQLLGSGITAPSRYTGDTNLWFYLRTLALTSPILLALWATSIPWVVKRFKDARLLAAWFVTTALCLMIFGTRAAYYLLPLLPALVLMSAEFSPLLRGRFAWFACIALLAVFVVGADYRPKAAPESGVLEEYSRLRRGNELMIVSPDDEFYASVLDLPKIRYVYLTALDPTKTSEFFYRLGMILHSEQFCSLDQSFPDYEQRLHAWKLPAGLHPEGTIIDTQSVSDLSGLISCSPDRDFLIPESLRAMVAASGDTAHVFGSIQSGRFFLWSKKSQRRADDSIAPGTVVTSRYRD